MQLPSVNADFHSVVLKYVLVLQKVRSKYANVQCENEYVLTMLRSYDENGGELIIDCYCTIDAKYCTRFGTICTCNHSCRTDLCGYESSTMHQYRSCSDLEMKPCMRPCSKNTHRHMTSMLLSKQLCMECANESSTYTYQNQGVVHRQ